MFYRISFFLLFLPSLLTCQNTIKGQFSPAGDYDFVIIYKLDPISKKYIANTEIDSSGRFHIDFDKEAVPGVYRMVYKLPQDENFVDFVYNGKDEVRLNFSKADGPTFLDLENKILQEYLVQMNTLKMEIFQILSSKNPDLASLKSLIDRQEQIQKTSENKAKDHYSLIFIKALRPNNPQVFNSVGELTHYRKEHYFDSIDLTNPEIQSSSFPLEKIIDYYDENVTLKAGAFYRSILNDIFFAIRETEPAFQKTLLAEFWSFLIANKKNNAAEYLADNYLHELATSLNDQALGQEIQWFKNLSIGSKAPDFSWKDQIGLSHSLYGLTGAKYYLIVFWSSECSHCMEQMPKLQKKISQLKSEDIQVLAVGLEVDPQHWARTIPDLEGFIHVLKTNQGRVDLAQLYNVTATPTYFVLDADKKIVAKPRGQENVFEVLDAIISYIHQ